MTSLTKIRIHLNLNLKSKTVVHALAEDFARKESEVKHQLQHK